jgi:hypothetical protein
VPRVYVIGNQSGRARVTGKFLIIRSVLWLAPDVPRVPGTGFFRRIAERRCGRRVAGASWVVVLEFPDAQTISASRGISFLVKTKRGWRLWLRYR